MHSLSIAALAIFAAAVMGFAIQRGGTCMVAAVDEAVGSRRFGKALALAEASLWVAGLLAAGELLGVMPTIEHGYVPGALALFGGTLLGFGALLNGACVFGSIARFGSGAWHYALTPLGYFLGSLFHHQLAIPQSPASPGAASPALAWIALAVFLHFLVYRLGEVAWAAWRGRLAAKLRLAHHATIVIGIAFVVLLLVAGPWTYTEALSRLAHGGTVGGGIEIALFLALLAGAVAGGWSGLGRIDWNVAAAARCLMGGALMGIGGAMIPGGNDNLILVGLPMAHGYAWLAISAMAAAIWIGLLVKNKTRKLPFDSVGDRLPAG